MYSGGFYPFETLEEFWAWWSSRRIFLNRYTDPPKPVYGDLLALVRNKDCFVLTTNVDHCFQKAGFDKKRLFYTQGDYGLWQCSSPAIIKHPFWRMTRQNPNAVYACVNLGQAMAPREIAARSICIDRDIGETPARLRTPQS